MLLALIVADCLSRPPSRSRAAMGSCAAAAMPWMHVRFFVVAVLLVAALTAHVTIGAGVRGRSGRARRIAAIAALGPFLLSNAAMALAFEAWYGSPWITASSRGAVTGQLHALKAAYGAIAQFVWGSSTAALPLAPVVLLSLVAVPLFCRRYGRRALFGLLVAVTYLVTIGAEGATIGTSFPGRYALWMLPFTALPLLFIVSEYPIARRVFVALGMLTGALTVAVVLQPLAGGTPSPAAWIRFVSLWPSMSAVGDVDVTASVAWTAGLLVVAAAAYVVGSRRGRPSTPARQTPPRASATDRARPIG